MTTFESAYSRMRRIIKKDQRQDWEAVAEEALQAVPVSELRKYALPLFRAKARDIYREYVRETERIAFDTGADPNPHPPVPKAQYHQVTKSRLEARRDINALSFPVANGGAWVTWADATEFDHLSRASWMRRKADHEIADAERHEAAAKLIREHGVQSLGQIPDWASMLGALEAAA